MVVADRSRPRVVGHDDGLQRHGNTTGGHTDISRMSSRLIPGAVIVAKGALYDHYGTVTGPDTVVHPVKTGPLQGQWQETSLSEFAQGRPVQVRAAPSDPQAAIDRARSQIGRRDYNVLTRNCETVAAGQSHQVKNAKGAAALGVLAGVAAGGPVFGVAYAVGMFLLKKRR